jgi:serine/threonine protein kinase
MASSIPFLQLFELGPEIASGYPFVIRECTSKADRSKLIVKVYCKLGQTREDLFKFRAELDFWRLVKHSALTTSADMYDEEGFTYLLYPFPAGGNLATLIGDPSRSFTEGFARYIAAILLEATSFLHSNGIVHGAILPYNVVFGSDTSVPGWVHSAKLAFYLSQSRSSTTVFTDLQDIAYTTCSILRQKSGMFPRNIFHPKYLGAAWQHLSPLFLSFITDLWNAERDGRNIDYFIIHPWVRGVNSIETTNSGRLAKNRARSDDSGAAKVGRRASLSNADSMSFSSIYAVSTKPDSGLTPDPRATLDSYLSANTVVIKRYIYYKMRDRTKIGTHKWTRALGTLESHFLVLDTLLERDSKNPEQDQILPQVLDLTGKTAIVAAGSRHNYTLGVFDVEQQRVVVWLRFDENDDYLLWKQVSGQL